MATIDVESCNVYYSATGAAASFVEMPEATGFSFSSESEGETTVRVFGGGKHRRTGDDTDTYELSALFDPAGQVAFRNAKRNGTTMYLALVWDDDTGAGQLQECTVDSYTWEAEAEGDFARFSLTATGVGTLTEITALP